MSLIYGFYCLSHNASSSLIVDGKIIYCVEEERFTRIKAADQYESYPQLSSKKIEEATGIKVKDADHKMFALPLHPDFAEHLAGNNFETCSHHTAHNYSAYFTSGMEGKVLAISLDGGGENHTSKVFLCEDGKMFEAKNTPISSQGSLGLLWAFITNTIRGYDPDGKPIWKMLKDEGKLMGMAPNGKYNERYQKILRSIISYKDFVFSFPNTGFRTRFVMDSLFARGEFDSFENIQDFAFNLQMYTEEVVLQFIDDLHGVFPDYSKICLSGGIFANVKLNQKINELPWVKEIYIAPPMGDEGLSLGVALKKAVDLGEITKPFKFQNVYLGFEYTDTEIFKISQDFDFIRKPYNSQEIAEDINLGKIIGWFQGKMEYGPRALGARSILTKATDPETHAKLNERLFRNDVMPFAPMVLSENFDEIFTCSKSKYAAEFMTICYTTKEEWIDKIPAVIQKTDKTARPQIINQNNNRRIWDLMNNYKSISGIPVILNTSFNIHNEPIIENPVHAFTHLQNKVIDKLVIGNYVYQNS
jgi:carbamoyltransferase